MAKTAALLHYPNVSAPPQGIWWDDGGQSRLGRFYVDSDFEALGTESMGSAAAHADSVDIEDFFDKMENSSPRPDVWAQVSLGDMTGPEFLRHEIRRFKKSK